MELVKMKRFKRPILYIGGIVFLLGIWFILSTIFDVNSMVFPNPFVTIKRMFELLGEKLTYKYLGFSLLRLLIGFAISFVVAFLLGMIVNNNDSLYDFFTPAITFLKAAPTATFVFLFIILSGAKNAPVYVVFTITMPILYESIVSAFRNTDKAVIAAAQIDGANRFKRMIFVQIPLGIPFIALGVASTFAMAFKIEIMAEIITGFTNGGLGSLIHNAQLINPTDLTDMFAYSLMAIILVLLVTLVTTALKKKNTPIKRHRDMFKGHN